MAYDYDAGSLQKCATEQCCDNPVSIRRPNLQESLRRELDMHKANVVRLEELLGLLEKNADVNRIMELLGNKY